MASISSTVARPIASRLTEVPGQQRAARSPTNRMPRPKSSRRSSRSLLASMPARRLRAPTILRHAPRARRSASAGRASGGRGRRSPAPARAPASWWTSTSPSPSMSMACAAGEVLEPLLDLRRAGRVRAAPVHLALGLRPPRSRRPGRSRAASRAPCPAGRFASTTCTTFGMTSPPFSMSTVSPTRTSLRATSSSLCRVARATVEPARGTGSRMATGVSCPVRPT